MPDPFLSVVVPVYNVEAFLEPMIDSLAPLAAWRVEIIFVEDCSTDGSHARLVELLATSPLKSQILRHDKNAGLSAARNTGLTVASGTYIWFVDSDDTINPAELPAWFEKLEIHDPDILLFDFANFEPGEVLEWSSRLPVAKPADIVWRPVLRSTAPNRLQSGKAQKVMAEALRDLRMHAWSYCFKRTLLPVAPFPVGRVYEDLATIPLLLHAAKTTYYYPAPMIYYRNRPDSITKFSSAKRDLDLAHGMARDWEQIARNRDKYSKADIVAYLATWMKTFLWSINNLHESSKLYDREVFAEFMQSWKAYRRAAGWQQLSAALHVPRPTISSRLAALVMTISPRLMRLALRRYGPTRVKPRDSSH